ncbi:hypothetical protein Tco_1303639 [Tanacetum coccineum]
MVQAKLKTLDALPSLLNKFTKTLNQFAQAIASNKTKDTSVPSAGQASTKPVEGEKNTNQATISQLFQRKAIKDAILNKHQSILTPPIITITTSTTSLQSPLSLVLQRAPLILRESISRKIKAKRLCLQRMLKIRVVIVNPMIQLI